MTNLQQNNFLLSGLNFDKHSSLRSENGQVYYVKNGDISDYTNSSQTSFVQNANSNELCVNFPLDYEYKGHIKLDKEDYVLFFKNSINSAIYLFNQELCTLVLIVAAECLNFQNIVTGVFKYHNGDRIIYFNDDLNPTRVLNLSEIPRLYSNYCDTCDNQILQAIDCSKLKIWKDFTPPKLELEIVSGNMPSGVYQVAVCSTDDNDNSDWFIYNERLNLHGKFGNRERFGINLKFDCFSTKGSFKVALIAHREDRGTVAQEIGIFDTNQSLINITSLDNTFYHPISNESLFEVTPIYQKSEFITTNSEQLVIGGLTERDDISFQSQANLITSKVAIIKVPVDQAHLYPTYMSDEVYKFVRQGVFKDGQTTNWEHIPNNVELLPIEDGVVTEQDDVWTDVCNPQDKKYWEVYNTAKLISLTEENDNGLTDSISEGLDTDCKKYKITTGSKYWYGTLTYESCETGDKGASIVVTEYGMAKDIRFCTKNISTAFFVFDAFNKQTDVVRVSEIGMCNPLAEKGSFTCTKFKLNPKYDAIQGTNCGIVTWDDCTVVDDGTIPPNFVQTCNISNTFEGDLTNFRFCACDIDLNSELNIEFNITVTPCTHTFTEIGQCATSTEVTEEDDNTPCDTKIVGYSTFGYWESDIKYPNNVHFENIPNKKPSCEQGIRYHKFPDRTAILNDKHFPHIHNNTANASSKEYVYILAPVFENLLPPVDCKGELVKDFLGWRIGVCSRENNRSVIHKGLLYNMREEVLEDCSISYYPNYPLNDLHADKLIGSKELIKRKNITFNNGYDGTFTPLRNYAKDKFQYISPDIQYEVNDTSATELITYSEENAYLDGIIKNTEEFPEIVMLSDAVYNIVVGIAAIGFLLNVLPLVAGGSDAIGFLSSAPEVLRKFSDGTNYAVHNTVKANYSRRNWNNINSGNRRRKVETSHYLQPTKQKIQGYKVNNYQRESGLFLALNKPITDPFVTDNSRQDFLTVGQHYRDESQTTLKASSYYVGLKKSNPSQYGNIMDGLVRPISDLVNGKTEPLISGDVYITKHTLTKKFPFFTKLPLEAPYDSPFVLSDSTNIGFPKYWLDNTDRNEFKNVLLRNVIGRLVSIGVGVNTNHYYMEKVGIIRKGSCSTSTNQSFRFGVIEGIFYTHYMSVVEYYCESEYIAPYREINEVPQSFYYPIQDINDFGNYNNMLYPEMFLYNQQQRFKGVPSKFKMKDYSKDCCDKNDLSKNRIIFSLKLDGLSKSDKWLQFKSNNYHQFSQQDGELQSIHAIDDYNLLFLFDNAAYVTQSDEGILTTKGTAYLGTGSVFQRRMKKISSQTSGLGGCIDKFAVVNTPYGVFYPDRKRKTFVGYTSDGIADISVNMKSFFNRWMDKEIVGVFDNFTGNIYWTCDDWTVSYKPQLKDYVSFHDFIPSWYIKANNNVLSLNNVGIWKHNVDNNYQTYYGKIYPFEVGFTINNKFKQSVVQGLNVFSEFYNNIDFGAKEYTNKFFNKGMVYNDFISSGVQPLYLKTPEKENDYLVQTQKGASVEVSRVEYNQFRVNGFVNKAKGQPLIKWENSNYTLLNLNESAIDSTTNSDGLIRGKWFNVHFISDDTPETKKLIQLNITNEDNVV